MNTCYLDLSMRVLQRPRGWCAIVRTTACHPTPRHERMWPAPTLYSRRRPNATIPQGPCSEQRARNDLPPDEVEEPPHC